MPNRLWRAAFVTAVVGLLSAATHADPHKVPPGMMRVETIDIAGLQPVTGAGGPAPASDRGGACTEQVSDPGLELGTMGPWSSTSTNFGTVFCD